MKSNLYETLGVSKDATKESIKKAYRGKAGKHHPDKGGCAKKFNDITIAYKVLSDDKRRRIYDETGSTHESTQEYLRNKAIQVLVDKFSRLIEEIPPTDLYKNDIIEILKQSVVINKKEFKTNIRKTGSLLVITYKIKKRLKKKSSKNIDILASFLDQKRQNHVAALRALNEHLKVAEIVLELLNDYNFEFDRMQQQHIVFTYGSSTATTATTSW